MPRSLPVNPSSRFLQLEAKNVIKAHRKRDASCCEILRRHPRFSEASDEEILSADISLQDAQHALALDYGCQKWPDLLKRANAPKDSRTDRELLKATNALQTSSDPYQLSHAIHTIGLLRIREGLPHITPFIESSSTYLQWEAVRAVIRILGDESRPLVYHLLDADTSDGVKEMVAAHFAESQRDEKSMHYLTTKFHSLPDGRYRHGIAYRLLSFRPDLAIPDIRKDIRSGNKPIRYSALISLRNVDYPERIEDWGWVIENEPVEAIRLKAIQIIAENRTRQMAESLKDLAASGSSQKIRNAAESALTEIQGGAA